MKILKYQDIFFYPNENYCKIKYANFFWLFDEDNYAYPSLKLKFCNKDGENIIKIFVRKTPDFLTYEYSNKPIIGEYIELNDYEGKKIKAEYLPFGIDKNTSKYIYGNNYLGRQLKNLGDLSMAFEASMKGINFYTQDLIAASYFILFNFYKFMAKKNKYVLGNYNKNYGRLFLFNKN